MIAKRAQEIEPFVVMEVMERAQQLEARGAHLVHLEVGEPDFATPSCIQEALAKALKDGMTGYTHSLGLLPLREAIAEHYHAKYGVDVSPDRIVVSVGTSPAMWMVSAALLEAGDEVIVSNPHYACYPNFIRFCGGEMACVDVADADGFQLRPEAVKARITARTKAILINSPANPTGTLLSKERMAALAALGPLALSDEIYHGLVYEGREHSILEFTDRAVVFNGLKSLYVNDPDSGIHGSASWALRKWKVALPELPVGEPVLTEEQKTRVAKLTAEVERIRQDIVTYEQKLPAQQAAWERQLREQPTALPASLSEGLVAHYPLDETEGKETANAVKGQSGGVYAGPGEPTWVPGVMGHAVRLNGNGGHFTCGEEFNPERTDSVSYGCWFFADANSRPPSGI